MEHKEGTFVSGTTELYYQSWHPEETAKATLVIVHGLGEHSGRYGNVVDAFVPQGYVIYSFDLRGHGRSPGQRGHVDDWHTLVEDVRAFVLFVREQEPERPFFLFGHSLGGNITVNYVLAYPDGLNAVTVSAAALDNSDVPAFLAIASKLLFKIKPDLSVNVGLDVDGLSRDTTVVEAYKNDPLVHGKGSPGAAIAFNQSVEHAIAQAGTFQPPLFMLHGDADRIVNVKSTHNYFPLLKQDDTQLIIYPGGYHESHNDLHKEQMLADMAAWFDAHMS